jgi:signal peptidase
MTMSIEFCKNIKESGTRVRRYSLVKSFYWVVTSVLGVMLAGLVFVCISPDYQAYIVRSESMKPAINMGDIIITGLVNGIAYGGIEPGTIVAFQTQKSLVTHRVVSVNNGFVVTKGDAVEDADPQPVPFSQVTGVYLFKIPAAGYLSSFIHTKAGGFLAVIVPALLFGGFIVKEMVKEIERLRKLRRFGINRDYRNS